MWSEQKVSGYKRWRNANGYDPNSTIISNITYLIQYQLGYMYWRYFMWNFAGRQNDYMNMDGNSLNGNWESGIGFIDNARLGTKGKNHYYFLPLIILAYRNIFPF